MQNCYLTQMKLSQTVGRKQKLKARWVLKEGAEQECRCTYTQMKPHAKIHRSFISSQALGDDVCNVIKEEEIWGSEVWLDIVCEKIWETFHNSSCGGSFPSHVLRQLRGQEDKPQGTDCRNERCLCGLRRTERSLRSKATNTVAGRRNRTWGGHKSIPLVLNVFS